MKKIICILLLLYSVKMNGQNLFYNPSFEVATINCQAFPMLPYLMPCNNYYRSIGSPDYFSLNYTGTCIYNIAPNTPFGFQLPKTGNSYVGFGVSAYPYIIGAREMITGQLTNALIGNHLYYVNFYVSACDNCHIYVDKIGAYFSVDSLSPDSDFVYQYTPQIENPTGNIITDTINWTAISGYFTAQGGEKWITIGNFRDDAHTQFDSVSNWVNVEAYYYLDDVSVIDCTATGINELNQINFTLLQNPVINSLGFTSQMQLQRAIIFNIVGEVLKTQTFSTITNYQIDVADLPKGIYFLQVETRDKRRGVRKFVKQ